MLKPAFGRASDQQIIHRAVAVGSHNDQFDVPRLRNRENRVGGIPQIHHELWLNSLMRVLLNEFPQSHLATLAQRSGNFRLVCLIGGIVGKWILPQFDYMLRNHRCLVVLRNRQRVPVRPNREIRKINRA